MGTKNDKKNISEIARQILDATPVERPMAERVGRVRGILRIAERGSAWQRQIRNRNWRP